MDGLGLLLVGVALAVGFVGIVVPILPGLLLMWGAVAVWAVVEGTGTSWTVLAVVTVITAIGLVAKYLVPGRRLREAGVPTRSLVIGGVSGIVGFFVIPVIGLVIGFVGGLYLAERLRLGGRSANRSTGQAVRAVVLAVAIELLTGAVVAGTWVVAVLTT